MITERENRIAALYKADRSLISLCDDEKGDYLHPVYGDGNTCAKVMFIGEAPGAEEAKAGRPFVGRAGEQLNRMLSLCGIDRNSLYVTNSVKFRPWKLKSTKRGMSASNRTPTQKEIKAGSVLLCEEIRIISPKVIVTLGNSPLKSIELISGEKLGNIGELHGRGLKLKNTDMLLFPLYHPASGIYNRELIAVMEDDLHKLKEEIGKFCTDV